MVYNFQQGVMAGAAGAAGGYTIDQSILFNDNDSAYLSKTFASGSTVTQYTISCWVKLGNYASLLGGNEPLLFEVGGGYEILRFDGTSRANPDAIAFEAINNCVVYTAAKHRDVSSWYHIVAVLDSPNVTQTDRIRIYVNGVRQSVSLQASKSWPTLNQTTARAGGAYGHGVGARNDGAAGTFFDGYIAEYYCLFGQALDPSSFGETNATTGQWVPIAYTGSYGSNDFYITGENSADLGADYSGNSNNFTSSGLTSADQVSDSPTDDAANGVGNYNTVSTLFTREVNSFSSPAGSITTSNGNLTVDFQTGGTNPLCITTQVLQPGKKYHFEWTTDVWGSDAITYVAVWLFPEKALKNTTDINTAGVYHYGIYTWNPSRGIGSSTNFNGSSLTSIAASDAWGVGEVLSLDIDMSTIGSTTVVAKLDGVTLATDSSLAFLDEPYVICPQVQSNAANRTWKGTFNFGASAFATTPLTDHVGVYTSILPDPTIADPTDYFQTVLDTGANIKTTAEALYTDQFEWIKDRININNHQLIDSVRGTSAVIWSNGSTAETTYSTPSGNSVGWVWNQNGTGSTNNDGTITSTVAANITSGFSTVTYTGSGVANDTVGHGLGVAPAMIMCFCLDSTANGTRVFHQDLTAGKSLYLNFNYAEATEGDRIASPTSTTFTVTGTAANKVNGSGGNYLAYCFTEVEGFSKIGSYTGNGSSDGPFVWCGFRPAFVLIKNASSVTNWKIFDSAREPYNLVGGYLEPNTSAAEANLGGGNTTDLDFVSNGFKIRGNASTINTSVNSHIFMAFAETPFKTANAR